ncbi:MAG: Crp/Fnr family transcriptional regulator [Caulobacteraceae bacterium]|nr:MAG: Crp/Fnr family transcriptional regulator [Caulobacteraceae bacterium]
MTLDFQKSDVVRTLVRKLQARDTLSEIEIDALHGVVDRVATFRPGDILVPEGAPLTHSQLQLSGLCARSKAMPDGRRQITALHIAGDFVDLHGFLLKRLEHDVVALSTVQMAMAPHDRLKDISETLPHLSRMLWLSTLIDAAIHREWIVSAGRRSAMQQVSHLFCELLTRYRVVGLADTDRFPMQMTQMQLADCCGLTPVHVSRVLRQLRDDGLVKWTRGEVIIENLEGLKRRAEFEDTYLSLEKRPR